MSLIKNRLHVEGKEKKGLYEGKKLHKEGKKLHKKNQTYFLN